MSAEEDAIAALKKELNKYGEKSEDYSAHKLIGARIEYQQFLDDCCRTYQVIRRCGSSSQEGWLFSLREVKNDQSVLEPWTYYTSKNIVLTENKLRSVIEGNFESDDLATKANL